MDTKNIELGGRILLSVPGSLSPSQESLYDAINKQAVPWAQAAGFVAKLDDGRLIGPFNVALQSPEIGAAFWKLQSVEGEKTSLSERVRQVVILTVGCAWKSAYELYAHTAVARKARFTEDTVAALARGGNRRQPLLIERSWHKRLLSSLRVTVRFLRRPSIKPRRRSESAASYTCSSSRDVMTLSAHC